MTHAWKWTALATLVAAISGLSACPAPDDSLPGSINSPPAAEQQISQAPQGKPVVYQVFTRLFGNKMSRNQPWGTIEENGVGKFADINDAALAGLRELGVTHVWYTGVPHHAVIRDYSAIGVTPDDPDVVKGRAGSPYAVKDYYNVNPDLATDPARRLDEFRALIDRTHQHGMRVLIDIVPNHVARGYQSISRPAGREDFGASDDSSIEWSRDNNFYYVPDEGFRIPDGVTPLGGDSHPLADGIYAESPAKWTGNGARAAQPSASDWYETVKINYGVRPDGSVDFDRLPAAASTWSAQEHAAFWQDRDVPDSWAKFRDIVLYWTDMGVDGFRYDMAEMVPVEFWSYLNSSILLRNDNAFLLAEVYNPDLYRDYIHRGLMGYLYDKVGFYDTLRDIMQGKTGTDALPPVQQAVADIEQHMLHFLENHDEQRIASDAFAGDAEVGRPAMVVSATISRSPTMLYFGQEVGEPGDGDAGFGDPTRTTIFDYWGVPAHQRWMNDGRFDGGGLSDSEAALRDFYVRLMSFSAGSSAMRGNYADLHIINRRVSPRYNDRLLSFARWSDDERLLIVSNFDRAAGQDFDLHVPASLIGSWDLQDGTYHLEDRLYSDTSRRLQIKQGAGRVRIQLAPLQSAILQVVSPAPE